MVLIPPSQHNSSISQEVEKAILKGMEVEAVNRPQSMQDWLKLLPIPKNSEDYTRLRNLLADQKWKEADKVTLAVMLKVTAREKEGSLSKESIENFPCEDLRTINELWEKYSSNHSRLFSFSTQKDIWEEVYGNYKKFVDRVNAKDSANGHFPAQYAQKRVLFPSFRNWVGYITYYWIILLGSYLLSTVWVYFFKPEYDEEKLSSLFNRMDKCGLGNRANASKY